ncbi:MAG: disulfide bond formation protein B [Candidatus Staskawiczbacteria bacterium]|jgi:disulfide bond formation protein DsbB
MAIDVFNKILATGVVISQVFIVLVILWGTLRVLFLRRKYAVVSKFLAENGIRFSFLVALIAAAGSLFYSNVAGFTPCELCWFQRIFMYPEVIILGLALIKKDAKIIDYALLLAFIGWLISLYHNYIYYQGLSSTVCRIGESCITPYVTVFGYITIPMMALTAFSLIIVLLLCQKTKTINISYKLENTK